MPRLGHDDLLGYYEYDDEGVRSHRVVLVDHGVLKDFEMSRSPLVASHIPMGTDAANSVLRPFHGRAT